MDLELRSCKSKFRYTKRVAKSVASRQTRRLGRAYMFYRCQFCERYHVGHRMEPRNLRALQKEVVAHA